MLVHTLCKTQRLLHSYQEYVAMTVFMHAAKQCSQIGEYRPEMNDFQVFCILGIVMFWEDFTIVIILFWDTQYHACTKTPPGNLPLCDSCLPEIEMFWEDFTIASDNTYIQIFEIKSLCLQQFHN